jgi:hypothetical protein
MADAESRVVWKSRREIFIQCPALSDDSADVKKIHLAAVAPVRRIDYDFFPVGAVSGMRVAAKLAVVLRGRKEMSERHAAAGLDVIQIGVLIPIGIRIGVIQDPTLVWQVSAVAVDGHHIGTDDLRLIGAVFIKVELVTV